MSQGMVLTRKRSPRVVHKGALGGVNDNGVEVGGAWFNFSQYRRPSDDLIRRLQVGRCVLITTKEGSSWIEEISVMPRHESDEVKEAIEADHRAKADVDETWASRDQRLIDEERGQPSAAERKDARITRLACLKVASFSLPRRDPSPDSLRALLELTTALESFVAGA